MKLHPRFAVALGLASLGLVSALKLGAQDVTVGAPVWNQDGAPPDEMPKSKGRSRPSYPAELKKTSEIGYVIITRILDEKGKSIGVEAEGTHLPFQRAVEEDFGEWHMTPAIRAGKAEEAHLWIPVIFNPKSAAPDGPDATPRLLAVTPVYTPTRPTRKNDVPLVRLTVDLDAGGAITGVKPEGTVDEKNLAAIQTGLKEWRFAPARKAGQPVAAQVSVTVYCQSKDKPTDAVMKQPRVIDQARPVYPFAMRRYGLTGQVLLDFEVDAQGKVKNATVVTSDNPAFDEPAIVAVREWKFQPGTKDGKPVSVRMRVPIVFQLDYGHEGSGAYRIEKMADQSKLAPAMRYDTPPVIRGVFVPVYPYGLRKDDVTGKAKVAMLINLQGRVSEVKVLSADKPELGKALVAALEGFRFDPALKDGKPVPHIVAFDQTFSAFELPDHEAERLISLEKKKPGEIYEINALDAPPKALTRGSPVFPVAVSAETKTGEAMVECLLDRDGRVRLPRVVNATEEAFGYAAVQAVAGWWFEPGLVKGKPVVVRLRIPFKFGGTPKGAKPTGEEKSMTADEEKK